jgi:hypothetical protein
MSFRQRLAVFLLALGCATAAQAIPVLQIYVDGATYDPISETWVVSQPDFDLWIVGDVDAFGPIYGVMLTASYFGLAGTMTLTPTTTSLIADPSTPPVPTVAQSGTGGHPVHPDHGIFNDVTLNHWDDWAVGDMALQDSPIGDYNGSPAWPTSFPDMGTVHVYRAHLSGWWKVHFDAYGTTVLSDGKETTWKTPYSHDGQVPVLPATWDTVKQLFR